MYVRFTCALLRIQTLPLRGQTVPEYVWVELTMQDGVEKPPLGQRSKWLWFWSQTARGWLSDSGMQWERNASVTESTKPSEYRLRCTGRESKEYDKNHTEAFHLSLQRQGKARTGQEQVNHRAGTRQQWLWEYCHWWKEGREYKWVFQHIFG